MLGAHAAHQVALGLEVDIMRQLRREWQESQSSTPADDGWEAAE